MTSERQDIHNSDIPLLCRSCEARHQGMCGVLNPQELVELARHTHKARHDEGAELIGDSTEIRSYANVMRGVVKLSKTLEDGRQQVVGLQFAPDFLGRLFGHENVTNAQAASPVELCVVPRPALERMMAANPALEKRLLRQTLRELDEARDWMVTLGRKTAGEKVASFLWLIATHLDPAGESSDGAEFDLPLSRADIGDFLGLTIETVSRHMSKLRQAGVIAITRNRHIEVPDLEALRNCCG
ncbi:CRP/FNR family transcriptional regulator [Devosia sp. UYZn731]|uniref:Crp/Fnr family transcriptional regulator n=1 Tax=Devosia sp. UYZn731 TaxID=3156345 RepID=UPI003394635B